MNRQIRRLGVGFLVLYAVLFAWLNVIQVLKADEYNANPVNNRAVIRDFGRPRGQIVSADGAVLARSVDDSSRFGRTREYPEGELFGQITGYFSFSYGTDGVERTYNAELTGRDEKQSLDDLVGLLLDEDTTNDVILTLDRRVQQVAREQLGDRRGSVVAIDPRDGSLLALWSFPSYDPGPLSGTDQAAAGAARQALLDNPDKPLLPRSFRETFFPGSTFKVVTAAAGLTSGTVHPVDTVFPTEREYLPPLTTRPIGNFGGSTCGGNLFDVLRVSCNVSFARMAVDAGAEAVVGTAHAFGFGEAPPLDLPSPAVSPIPEVPFFDRNTPVLAQVGIGQNEVRSTPLQMALVAAAVANGGEIMVPHVLKEVRDRDNEVVDTYVPRVWQRAMSVEVATLLRDAMALVVTGGTARNLAVPGVTTAGKTGTAQVGDGTAHTWIIGFAPVEEPRVAIAVIVENLPGEASESTGGRVAAPIGRAVLEAALNRSVNIFAAPPG